MPPPPAASEAQEWGFELPLRKHVYVNEEAVARLGAERFGGTVVTRHVTVEAWSDRQRITVGQWQVAP